MGPYGEFLLAPCIPFLLTFPALCFGEGFGRYDELLSTFAMGLVGYTIVSIGLFGYLSSQFDRLAGRVDEGSSSIAESS